MRSCLGNYDRLRRATIEALGPDYSGHTLQLACAYGSFTPELAQRVGAAGGSLDVIDALPVQIDNVRRKAAEHSCVRATLMDAAALDFEECTFDRVVLFMLLHEQPEEWRRHTIAEAARVLKPGGDLWSTDYARPDWRHPLRYLLPRCSPCWSPSRSPSGKGRSRVSLLRRRCASPPRIALFSVGSISWSCWRRSDVCQRRFLGSASLIRLVAGSEYHSRHTPRRRARRQEWSACIRVAAVRLRSTCRIQRRERR